MDGGQVRYWEGGEGSPIVLIHGLGSSALSWRSNLEALAQGQRVYALDLPGHGSSDKPQKPVTLSHAGEFIVAFMDALGVERSSLIGNSAGGLISLEVALSYAERVVKLVLVDSAGLGSELDLPLRLITIPYLGEVMAEPSGAGIRALLERVFYDRRLVSEELIEAILKDRKRPGNKETLLSSIRQAVGLRGLNQKLLLRDRLPEISVRTLIVWGAEDQLIPVSHAYEAHRLIPGSRLQVFPECGHWPQVEKAEEFNRLVGGFLDQQG